jgi:hypothetical protein
VSHGGDCSTTGAPCFPIRWRHGAARCGRLPTSAVISERFFFISRQVRCQPLVRNSFVAFATYSPISLKGSTTPELSFSDVRGIVESGLRGPVMLSVHFCSGGLSVAGPVPYSILLKPSWMKVAKLAFSVSLSLTCVADLSQ